MHRHAHRHENSPYTVFRWLLLKLKTVIWKGFLKLSNEFLLLFYFKIFLVAPGLKDSTCLKQFDKSIRGKSQSMREIWHAFQMKIYKQFHAHYKELIIQTLSVLSAPSVTVTEKHHPSLNSLADKRWPMAHLKCDAMIHPLVHCIWRNYLTIGAHFISIPFKMCFIFTILSKNIKLWYSCCFV